MRKKFLSAFMLGVLSLAATSTIVSCKDYDDDISKLENDIQSLNQTLSSQLTDLKNQLSAQKSELETKIQTAQTTLQAAIDKKADQTTVDALTQRVVTLENELAVVKTRLDVVEGDIKTLKDTKADKSELERVEQKIGLDIAAVTGRVDVLEGIVEGLVKEDGVISGLQTTDNKLQEQINKINNILGGLEEGDVNVVAQLLASVANLELQDAVLAKADSTLDARTQTLENTLVDYPAVKDSLASAQNDIATLQNDLTKAKSDLADLIQGNENDIKALGDSLDDFMDDVNKRFDNINSSLNALTVCVTKRLTSIYFAPTTFIDGVEAINFETLKYSNWNNGKDDNEGNWYADEAPAKAAEISIGDGTTTAVYYLNPSSVDEKSIENGIKGLSFISNVASNKLTRAADGAVISIAEGSIKDGKLTLKLKKNAATINSSNEDFTIVALKAPLSETVKTAEEQGKEINVYSDWARLTEETVTPHIHNAQFIDEETGKATEHDINSHFRRFSDIYSQYSPNTNAATAMSYKYTAQERDAKEGTFKVGYKDTLDINELTAVCDKDGNVIDFKAFGLKFEYRLVPEFWVLNEGQTVDATNQQLYAKLENGKISSKTLTGDTSNRDAIGKSPVVQIILRDTVNNAVAEVKYLMVKWTETSTEEIEVPPFTGGTPFDCGEVIMYTFYEKELNSLASILNVESTKLFEQWSVGEVLYNEKEEAIGTVERLVNGGTSGQIDNILVKFADGMTMNDSLYNAGDSIASGYFYITNKQNDPVRYKVPVKVTITFDVKGQLKYNEKYAKRSEYWTADGIVTINSIHYDNRGNNQYAAYSLNLLDTYQKDGKTAPAKVKDIISGAQEEKDAAYFEIDEAALKASGYLLEGTKIYSKGKDGKADKELATFDGLTITLNEYNGKALLDGAAIPVKLVAHLCNLRKEIDSFKLTFKSPLTVTSANPSLTFKMAEKGLATESGSLKLTDMMSVVDVYGATIYAPKVFNSTLNSYYGISTSVNTGNVKVDDTKIGDIKNTEGKQLYGIEASFSNTKDDPAGGVWKFTFKYLEGTPTIVGHTVTVPVTVNSKWQTVTYNVTINVQ